MVQDLETLSISLGLWERTGYLEKRISKPKVLKLKLQQSEVMETLSRMVKEKKNNNSLIKEMVTTEERPQ